ncbi:MAG: hypothetical protein R6X29_11300 [Acidimicrobiia bacterium]|jgi:hypothetical protein
MTARPIRAQRSHRNLRVLEGRRTRRIHVAPWMVFSLVAIAAIFGLAFSRTALDDGAFRLSELERSISEAADRNTLLRVEIARLENPARVAPLATQMGMVYPDSPEQLLVAGITIRSDIEDPRWAEIDRLAADLP